MTGRIIRRSQCDFGDPPGTIHQRFDVVTQQIGLHCDEFLWGSAPHHHSRMIEGSLGAMTHKVNPFP